MAMLEDGFFSKVELSVSCNDLGDLDAFSKSDPQCILYRRRERYSPWEEFGRTEIIWDCLNPQFVTSFVLDFQFESVTHLKFLMVDVDRETSLDVSNQDFIGEFETTLGAIVGSAEHRITAPLRRRAQGQYQYPSRPPPPMKKGTITVCAEELLGGTEIITLQFSLSGLKGFNLFAGVDPFLVISRVRDDDQVVPVHRTEVAHANAAPTFEPFQISMQRLCNGNHHRRIFIQCYDHRRSGNHQLVGGAVTTFDELQRCSEWDMSVMAPTSSTLSAFGRPKARVAQQKTARLHLNKCSIVREPSFLDYVRGGFEFRLIVGIDFTISNGDPAYPFSLHYCNHPEGSVAKNEYIEAIRTVGEILACYDTDKKYSVFGFGAMVPPADKPSHCFAVNFNEEDPEVDGIEGIVDAYKECVPRIRFHGPTFFNEIIRKAATLVRQGPELCYHILLIITDGELNDQDATIEEIVYASTLPLSIIIVGVGGSDWEMMRKLDADQEPLVSSDGRQMQRDIVQFVPFREFSRDADFAQLAKKTLEEVPTQFLTHMKKKGVLPHPKFSEPPKPICLRSQSYSTLLATRMASSAAIHIPGAHPPLGGQSLFRGPSSAPDRDLVPGMGQRMRRASYSGEDLDQNPAGRRVSCPETPS